MYASVYLSMTPRAPFFTLLLVVANLLSYALELVDGGQAACEAGGLIPARFLRSGDLEPLLSSMFLHDPEGFSHLAGNMIFLIIFGTIVESALGHLAFLGLYLAAGVVAGLSHVAVSPTAIEPMVGASGAIYAVIAVAAALRPRLLGFAVCFVALDIYRALTGTADAVAVGAHLGGFSTGVLFSLLANSTVKEARFA